MFDIFIEQIILTGKIVTIDPIHIGSSGKNSLNPVETDNSVLKDFKGYPVIPGASLKGVIRTRFEAILRSIAPTKVCDIFNNSDPNCITNNDASVIKKDGLLSNADKAFQLYAKSCDVCKLFGGRETGGKLQFKDCCYVGDKIRYEHRDGVGIDRDTGAAKRNAKYDYEIVSKDTEFDFYMIAENLDEQQLKYLDFIIKQLESGELSVGGKTSRGLGRFKLIETNKQITNAADLKVKLGL